MSEQVKIDATGRKLELDQLVIAHLSYEGVGWSGDASPSSRVWITDLCAKYRIDALPTAALASMRTPRTYGMPVDPANVDETDHGFSDFRTLAGFAGPESFEDAPPVVYALPEGVAPDCHEYKFSLPRAALMRALFPSLDLALCFTEKAVSMEGRLHVLAARRGEEVVGALLGIA